MNFFIDLNRWYNKYKLIIWFTIILIVFFLLVANRMNKVLENTGNSSNSNITTISENIKNDTIEVTINNITQNGVANKTQNEITNDIKKIEESITSKNDAIEAFILLCNNKNIGLAYNMLSDDCRNLLYPTEQKFVDSYYNVIFKTYKQSNVVSFKNNTYKVDFTESAIATGGDNKAKITEYITVDSNNKLNISNFIERKDIEKSNNNSYLKINVKEKIIYKDYEVYIIKVQNLTDANMYINDIDNSNLFIKNSIGTSFNISNEEYIKDEYYISPKGEKEIKLKFYKTYQNDEKNIVSVNFNNIKIENKVYYDANIISSNVVSGNSQNIIYEQKSTTYPNKVELSVNIQ